MDQPVASLIIPTFNRKQLLHDILHSLTQQRCPAGKFEVIVVDDGSTDGTEQVVREAYPYPVHYLRQANQGSAVARNRGAQEAQGQILIFLDDDMLVDPDYVMGLIEEHHRHSRIVGMGTELPSQLPDASLFAQITGQNAQPHGTTIDSAFVQFTACVTNNLSVMKEDFFEIGMMQDVAGDGPTWWGDVDFGYRAAQLGYRFRRSGAALCYHRDYSTRDLATTTQRMYKVASMAVALFHKHPGVEPYLPMFRDKGPILLSDPISLTARKVMRHIVSSRPALWALGQIARLLEKVAPSSTLLRPVYRWIVGGYIFQGYHAGLHKYGPVEKRRQ